MNLNQFLNDEARLLTFGFWDDFDWYSFNETGSEGRWDTIEADAGASWAHDVDGLGGRMIGITGATDNNEVYLGSQEIFQFVDGKPGFVLGRMQYAESATDDANVAFGLMETVGGNVLQNDGGGPKADFDGAVIYKRDGDTRWRFMSSDGTTQTDTELDYTAGGSGFVTLGIHWNPISSTEILITPFIDTAGGIALTQAREYDVSPRVPLVQHRTTYAGAGNMALMFGIKAGSASSEQLIVDYALGRQKR